MSQSPAVSVLLPVYNRNSPPCAAVDSILAQTLRDFEFIIIDDGSTDGTAEILRQYAQADSRIRLVSRPNKGLTVTLNEGIAMAVAPLLARMDGDDIAAAAIGEAVGISGPASRLRARRLGRSGN